VWPPGGGTDIGAGSQFFRTQNAGASVSIDFTGERSRDVQLSLRLLILTPIPRLRYRFASVFSGQWRSAYTQRGWTQSEPDERGK